MKKLKDCYIICKDPDEKIKVLLVLLINHTWNSGSKDIIPPKSTIDMFNSLLVLIITDGRIIQGSSGTYKKAIDPYDVINETDKYLNALQ